MTDSADSIKVAELAVSASMKWLDTVLFTGFALVFLTLFARFCGLQKLSWNGVDVNVDKVWLIFLLLTFAHLHTTNLLLKAYNRAWREMSQLDRKTLADRLSVSGGIFVRGFIPRKMKPGDRFRRIHPSDGSGLVSILSFFLLIASVTPFKASWTSLGYSIIGFALAEINWFIGSCWASALSDLPDAESIECESVHEALLKCTIVISGSTQPSFVENPLLFPLRIILLMPFIVFVISALLISAVGRLYRRLFSPR